MHASSLGEHRELQGNASAGCEKPREPLLQAGPNGTTKTGRRKARFHWVPFFSRNLSVLRRKFAQHPRCVRRLWLLSEVRDVLCLRRAVSFPASLWSGNGNGGLWLSLCANEEHRPHPGPSCLA